jgi:hypothetical protein
METEMTGKIFYHCYVDGYMKHAKSLADAQEWLDGIRHRVVGCELKIWRVVDCLADVDPVISGPVTA